MVNHGQSSANKPFSCIFHSSLRLLEGKLYQGKGISQRSASPSKQPDISHPQIHNVGTKGKKKQLASHIGKSSNADFATNGLMTVPVCESKRRYRVSSMRVSAREDIQLSTNYARKSKCP